MLKDIIKSMTVLLIFSIFFYKCDVYADVCDTADVQRLKEMAKNVDVDYEYINDGDTDNAYYISFIGLTDELTIIVDGKEYTYDDVNNSNGSFVFNSGTHQFEIYSVHCPDILLDTMNIQLPRFNVYSRTSECKQLKKYNLKVCDEWYQAELNDSSFFNVVNQYLEKEESSSFFDTIVSFLKKYYLFFIGGLFLIIFIVIGIIVHKKRSVLE